MPSEGRQVADLVAAFDPEDVEIMTTILRRHGIDPSPKTIADHLGPMLRRMAWLEKFNASRRGRTDDQ